MRYSMLVLLLAALLSAGACEKGKDGEDGKVYGYILSTSNVTTYDLSEIIVGWASLTSLSYDTRYELISGNHTIYWIGGCSGLGGGWCGVAVEIEGGKDGKKGKDASLPLVGKGEEGKDGDDHLYYGEFINTTVFWDDEFVDNGDAPGTLSTEFTQSQDGPAKVGVPAARGS